MGKKGLNIYHRKDGRWEGRYKEGFQTDGMPKYRSIYGKTYAEVKEKLIAIKATAEKPLSICSLTVERIFTEWLNIKKQRVKESTAENYTFKANKHILTSFGKVKISDLSPNMVNDFIKSTCIRFNLDKPLHQQAWEILQEEGKSYTQTVTAALLLYGERQKRLADDPYFENREREDRFVEQIVSAVEQALEKALPGFMAGCLLNMVQPYSGKSAEVLPVSVPAEPKQPEIEESAIDWDFIGG